MAIERIANFEIRYTSIDKGKGNLFRYAVSGEGGGGEGK